MDLTPNRNLLYLNKAAVTKFYKRYLNSYHTFEYQLKSLNDDAETIAGSYYGILAIHSRKTKSLDILLGIQIVTRSGYWRKLELVNIFHKRNHKKPNSVNQYLTIKRMYPKLGKVRCISFKGMPPVLRHDY